MGEMTAQQLTLARWQVYMLQASSTVIFGASWLC